MRRGSFVGVAGAVAALALGLYLAERPWRGAGTTLRPQTPNPDPSSAVIPAAPMPTPPSDGPPVPEPIPEPGEISVLSLLGEMSRLDHLAGLSTARFVTRQQSSADRRARTPGDPETWFANDDFVTNTRPNLVRVEDAPGGGKRYVLLDIEGPGAVVRIWTATPAGTLRLYIDGDARPALEADMRDLLAGRVPPFVEPLGQITAMGHSLYFPFPYRTRCLITLDSIMSVDPFSGQLVDKVYYQIGTRTYPASAAARVRSYAAPELDRARGAIARVAAELRGGAPDQPPAGRITVAIPRTSVNVGEPATITIPAAKGGGRISALRLFTNERDPARLRSTLLSIAFDNQETVRVPLVDFFGTGPGWNPYASLPMTVGTDGNLVCRFPMPFRKRAVVSVVRNATGPRDGDGPIDISGDVAVDPHPFGHDTLLFHAGRRPPETLRTRPFRDWHIATLTGQGHLVGTVFDVDNPPGAAWWGEGDEKIYVDGETFPGIFGTGTEDYFGYAWSSTALFAHAYHAQTRATGPGFSGQFSMNRFHILDPIPFEQSLRFDLEAWHWTDTSMTLGATLYWYARPGGSDDFPTGRP